MKMRMAALPALVVATCAGLAQADFIREVASGTFEVTSDDGFTRTMSNDLVVLSEIGGWGILSISADTEQTFQAGADTFSGTATFQGAGVDDMIVISLTGTADGQDGQQNFSFSGLWETVSASGTYEGLTGSGDFSGSAYFTADDSGVVDMIFQGDLVPTPATASLMVLGGLAATRRRRA
ncbi:MAG TPA: hypothetical protein VFF69_13265 [Phycisphaerales bacterium]|nr:hypothetical protein [Phycisphaerales bacterium]